MSETRANNPMAGFQVDHSSGLPVWIQVKNRIAYLIGAGKYLPGDKLPTVRALAVDLDSSYNTTNQAPHSRRIILPWDELARRVLTRLSNGAMPRALCGHIAG